MKRLHGLILNVAIGFSLNVPTQRKFLKRLHCKDKAFSPSSQRPGSHFVHIIFSARAKRWHFSAQVVEGAADGWLAMEVFRTNIFTSKHQDPWMTIILKASSFHTAQTSWI